MIYEEFGDILPADTKELILESLYNNTVGDSYRVGGVDDDNLYPSYTNPALMRAVASGWTGRKLNESNMTAAGEMYATEILDLFDLNGTLSEFNSPTYAGVSLYALTLWAKYMPADSVMGQNGARMIGAVWNTSAALYNANMRNLAGPWDRAYGYDMNQYVAIFSLFIWTLVGKEAAPFARRPWAMTHADDFEYAPLIAVLAPFHDALVPASAAAAFAAFPGEHELRVSAYSPPSDNTLRNITSWVSANLTIGATSFDETDVGGPRLDSSQVCTERWVITDPPLLSSVAGIRVPPRPAWACLGHSRETCLHQNLHPPPTPSWQTVRENDGMANLDLRRSGTRPRCSGCAAPRPPARPSWATGPCTPPSRRSPPMWAPGT